MHTPFDPTTYTPTRGSSALAGYLDAHGLTAGDVVALLANDVITAIHARVPASVDQGWIRWLIFDAALERFGGLGATIAEIERRRDLLT